MIDFTSGVGLLFLLVLLAGKFWLLALELALLGAVMAFVVAPGAVRRSLGRAAIASALFGLGGVWFNASETARVTDPHVPRDERFELLAQPRIIDAMPFPAGTEIGWTTSRHEQLSRVWLPRPAPLLGVVLEGKLEGDDGTSAARQWKAHMVNDAAIDSWSCLRGEVTLRADRSLVSCRLASGRAWRGFAIPAGSWVIQRDRGGITVGFTGPAPLPDVDATLHADDKVYFSPEGAIETLFSDRTAPLLIQGLPFEYRIDCSYPRDATFGDSPGVPRPRVLRVEGQISTDTIYRGQVIAAGTHVVLRLDDGTIVAQ